MPALTALLAAALVASPAPGAGEAQRNGITVHLNGGDYRPGDRVVVAVEPEDDGYLLVLRVDGDGYVRALFPLDPDLDQFARGGRRYELRGRNERQSFLADDRGGTGVVMAFLAREPFRFAGYAVDTHWDYERLRLNDPAGDVEGQLVALVREMAGGAPFDYDVIGYRVWGPGYESSQPVVVADPYDNFGPSYACLACGYGYPGSGVHISVGGGWYDPWYDPWYDRWGYWGYRRSSWNGWWGWDPYWGTPWRPVTVINVPPRPVVPNPIYGTRSRAPIGGVGPTRSVPRLDEPITGAPRPVTPAPGTAGRSRVPNTPRATPVVGRSAGQSESPPARTPVTPPRTQQGDRSRTRGNNLDEARPVLTPPPVETRRTGEQPVYRPPVVSRPAERPAERQRSASSPPPRAPERSAAPRNEPRAERPAQVSRPVERSSPPPAPPRTVERSSPPPSGGSSSGGSSSRSRSRGNN